VPNYFGHYFLEMPGPIVNQDEAFNRAIGAMYWAGYYSAVYHCQRNKRPVEDDTAEQEYEEKRDEESEGLISKQR